MGNKTMFGKEPEGKPASAGQRKKVGKEAEERQPGREKTPEGLVTGDTRES